MASIIKKKTTKKRTLKELSIRESDVSAKLEYHQKKANAYAKKLNKIQEIKKKTTKKKKLHKRIIQPISQDLLIYKQKELKDFCKQRKLHVTGKKSELIERLRDYTLNSSAEIAKVQEKDRKIMEELGSIRKV